MNRTWRKTGTLTVNDLAHLPGMPSRERLEEGPVAVIECAEEIPCDPCVNACPRGAIVIRDSLLSLPELRQDFCTGCQLCIPRCPGLAIFVVDLTHSPNEALVAIPYEFLPLPEAGETVGVTDRFGQALCEGTIYRVRTSPGQDRTAVVSVVVPRLLAMEARGINPPRSTP